MLVNSGFIIESVSSMTRKRRMANDDITRLHDDNGHLCALGIVFYFIDYLYKYVKARRIAFWFVSYCLDMADDFLCVVYY